MLIDTHTHLDNEAYLDDLDEVLQKARQNEIKKFIIPGTNKQCLKRSLEICEKEKDVFFSLGFHPYDIHEYDENIFSQNITNKKCVAIGECGLDYFRLESDNKQEQKDIFTKHIQIAKQNKKPLILHIRDAKENFDASLDAKQILIENNAKEVGGVLHCFNANQDLLELSEHNFYFGIGGVLSFKNAKELVEVLPKIPTDKLLLETDSPYLTPHPYRGTRNEPYYIKYVFEKVSEILKIDEKELEEILHKNTKTLFNIF